MTAEEELTFKRWMGTKWSRLALRLAVWSLPFIGMGLSWMVYDSREIAQKVANALEVRTKDTDLLSNDLKWQIKGMEQEIEAVRDSQRVQQADLKFIKDLLLEDKGRKIALREGLVK